MDRPNDTLVFALGCIGALAPEIVRLYRLRTRPPKKGFSSFYWVITIIYALLGGVVALALPAVTIHAALYAGISASITVSAVARTKRTLIQTANSAEWTPPVEERRPFSELLRTHANGLFTQTDYDT